MPEWNYREKNGIRIVTVPEWSQAGAEVAFTTRWGGVSSGNYAALNLGLHVGDQRDRVLENRSRLLQIFDADLRDAVCCEQVHGCRVAKVTVRDQGRGAFDLDSAIPDCDAMITDQVGLWLLSFYADCIPVCFYDPVHRSIGVAHCGWKGTMDRIADKTLRRMQVEYGTSADQVQVFIGPGIGPCCFVIQPDLQSQVEAEFHGWHDIMTVDADGKITWNLPETNRRMLIAGGVRSGNIAMCEVCTACHPKVFYSYRREQGNTGRMGALLGLKY